MRGMGLLVAGALACAVVASPAGAATAAAGSTTTTLALCPSGPAGVTYPGATAPAGCQGGSGATLTVCKDADVHAFVGAEVMLGGKRPAFSPLAGVVAVHVENPSFGFNQNVETAPDYGTALMEMGAIPPGSYTATATLWSGSTTNVDGTALNYASSSATMTLVVTDSPCDGSSATPTTTSAKKGCGVGDAKHEHDPGPGKTCPK